MKRLRALWPVAAALAVGLPVPLFRLHFFHTESAPIGLWRALPGRRPRVGDVVRFCMRADQARATAGRPYAGGSRSGRCPYGTWMLTKPVLAGPGDTVVHTPAAVLVNGRAEPLSARGPGTPAGWRCPRPRSAPSSSARGSSGCTRRTRTARSTAATWASCGWSRRGDCAAGADVAHRGPAGRAARAWASARGVRPRCMRATLTIPMRNRTASWNAGVAKDTSVYAMSPPIGCVTSEGSFLRFVCQS